MVTNLPIPPPRGGARRARTFFRAAATLLGLTALVQVGFAAGYIGGDYDALKMHDVNARAVISLALITAGTAVWFRRAGGPMWPVPVSVVLVLALAGELILGIAHAVAPHIALGVIVVSAIAVLVSRAWIDSGAPVTSRAGSASPDPAEPSRSSTASESSAEPVA
ncbi:hypothetical protein [Streptomyces sp. NPDC048436]|uniref:hypothetical protein n=1 Tax=Streptomyces sp. NPDC048436 TaxID=3365550 RepID=UPI00371D289B